MAYGEMGDEVLRWAAQSAFGLSPMSMPANIVVAPPQGCRDLPRFADHPGGQRADIQESRQRLFGLEQ